MPITSLSHMSNFQATLNANGGPANPSRFMFVIGGMPNVMTRQQKYSSVGSSFLRSLQFLCETSDLPGLTIHTNKRPGYSPIMQSDMPGTLEYQPVNLSVICRDYMKEKEFFDDWIFSIKNAFSSTAGAGATFDNAYYNNFTVDCAIFLLSNYGAGSLGSGGFNGGINTSNSNTNFELDPDNVEGSVSETRYAVRLQNLYPTAIDSIALSWQDESAMRLNMTFTYSNWEPIIGASAYAHVQPGTSTAVSPDSQITTTNTPVNPNSTITT